MLYLLSGVAHSRSGSAAHPGNLSVSVCVRVCVCVCVCSAVVCGAQPCGKKEEQRSQSTHQPPFSSVGLDELPGPCNRVLLDD